MVCCFNSNAGRGGVVVRGRSVLSGEDPCRPGRVLCGGPFRGGFSAEECQLRGRLYLDRIYARRLALDPWTARMKQRRQGISISMASGEQQRSGPFHHVLTTHPSPVPWTRKQAAKAPPTATAPSPPIVITMPSATLKPRVATCSREWGPPRMPRRRRRKAGGCGGLPWSSALNGPSSAGAPHARGPPDPFSDGDPSTGGWVHSAGHVLVRFRCITTDTCSLRSEE